MKKFHLFAISLFTITHLFSQNPPIFQWMKNINTSNVNNDCGVNGVAADASGNVYATGWFKGTVPFGPSYTLTSTGGSDFFIAKYNSAGTIIWAKKFGSAATEIGYDIQLDNNSNIYVCGDNDFTSGSFDFDPGPGVAIPSPWRSAFVAKYDQNGNYIWAQEALCQYGEIDLTLDKFGNVFCLGTSSATQIQIEKYDNSGTFINAAVSMGNAGNVTGGRLAADSTGNIYLAFCHTGTVVCGSLTSISAGSNDIELVKYSNTLSPVWIHRIGGTSNECADVLWLGVATRQVIDITIDNQQNLCCAGMFSTTVNFGPSTFTSSTGGDGFFGKFSTTTGVCLFVKQLSGGGGTSFVRPSCIRVDGNDNIHIAGCHRSTVDCDPGPGTAIVNGGSGGFGNAFFYSRYDINGNYIASGGVGNFNMNERARPNEIFVSTSSIYVGGEFFGTQDFDMGTGTFNAVATPTSGAGFVAKYDFCNAAPSSPSSITGLSSFCPGAGIQSYSIAPVSGATSYSWSLPGGWTGISSTNTIAATTGTASGNISVTANNACGSSSASVLSITVNPNPTLTVNSGSICSGSSFTMIPSGASTYTFSSGSAIVSPTTNTSYSVTGTSSAGCVGSNTAVASITVSSTPTVSVNSGSICSGSSFTMTPNGASTYTFSSGSAIVSPTTNTSYSVSGTSTSGCVSSSQAVSNVTVVANPTASATTSQTITCATPNIPLNGSGVSTYTWSGPGIVSGSNTANPSVNIPGTYSLVGSTSGCNSNTATVIVSSNTIAPTLSVSTSNSLICGPPFQGTATINASGASTYTWNTSATTNSISVSPGTTTQYTVTGTAANGCTNTAVFTQSVSACTGVSTTLNDRPEFEVFPNPTNGNVIVSVPFALEESIEIYNAIGERILNVAVREELTTLDLSQYPSGIYFIRIGMETKKIIKQ